MIFMIYNYYIMVFYNFNDNNFVKVVVNKIIFINDDVNNLVNNIIPLYKIILISFNVPFLIVHYNLLVTYLILDL